MLSRFATAFMVDEELHIASHKEVAGRQFRRASGPWHRSRTLPHPLVLELGIKARANFSCEVDWRTVPWKNAHLLVHTTLHKLWQEISFEEVQVIVGFDGAVGKKGKWPSTCSRKIPQHTMMRGEFTALVMKYKFV